jgi:hypothetical protein
MTEFYYSDEKSPQVSKAQLISEPKNIRPHVVILGAGASRQAFPQGDSKGKTLPIMDDFVNVVTGLRDLLESAGINHLGQNFEVLYSKIHERDPKSSLLCEIEKSVRDYFEGLQLPEGPTLYDHLLLSLRPKDLIATFNWDPFLFDSWERHRYRIPLPEVVYLHGNVRIAYCAEHRVLGEKGMCCPECDEELTPSPLLYPVTTKNYSADPLISSAWRILEHIIRSSFTLTIFGYGAPKTDKEAVELLNKAWKGKSNREFETVEIIDIKDKNLLIEQWKPFMPTFHCMHSKNFYESQIANYPRRSCEALYVPTVLGRFAETYAIPKDADFKELMS